MSLTGRNPTIRLSIIRSQIDKQQQVIALLENRLQEAILGGTDVGDIYGDGDLETILDQVARIYGDDQVTDSRFDYLRDAQGAIVPGADNQPQVYQLDAAGNQQLINDDTNLAGDYALFDANGNVDADEYNRYTTDYNNHYGALPLAQQGVAAELTDTFTDLTGAMHKGVLDFQQVDSSGEALPLEQDGIRQLLYQARALMGELRVEEQHWNAEVNEEKSRRKELVEFTKG
ncbi:MAG: hypothetical protein OXU45_00310 [Candidatus Melainabacteria bacterium]|nr:hypothetical protein [Candidatus Melainabacteria bacterium]